MLYSAQLDNRKSIILKAVVTDYVKTAQPVGSEYLARRHALGIKPATIRNELAEMAEMGYLRQPHTSAGRIPSDLGYRFYVDKLMEPSYISAGQARRAESDLGSQWTEMDEIIYQSCRVLAGLTHYASLATQPSMEETTVRLVNLSRLAPDRLLLVVALSNGGVEHAILEVVERLTDGDAVRLSNALSAHLVGKALRELSAPEQDVPNDVPSPEAYQAARARIGEMARAAENSDVFIEGTSNILKQPEFKDVNRLEHLLAALQEKKSLLRLLSKALLGPGATVIIGSENPNPAMRDASLVTARYSIGGRVCGTIGVVGPTRMDYRHSVAAVNLIASLLSDLLTRLSVE
jgi:heat-inducible transcriptional repressor